MYNTIYIIPSYNRYDKLLNIVNVIKSFDEKNVIIILNDASTDVKYINFRSMKGVDYMVAGKNRGKIRYWETVSLLLQRLKYYKFEKVCMLADDFNISVRFEDELKNYNPDYILRLFLDLEENWGFTHWVDGAFICDHKLLDALNYKVPPLNIRGPKSSSGVGKYMSKVIKENGLEVEYRGALLKHIGNDDSKMNHNIRKEQPLLDDETGEWL